MGAVGAKNPQLKLSLEDAHKVCAAMVDRDFLKFSATTEQPSSSKPLVNESE